MAKTKQYIVALHLLYREGLFRPRTEREPDPTAFLTILAPTRGAARTRAEEYVQATRLPYSVGRITEIDYE